MQRTNPYVASMQATHPFRHLPAIFLATCAMALAPTAVAEHPWGLVENGGFERPEVPDIYPDCERWATYFGQNGAAEAAAGYCFNNDMNAHCIDEELVDGWSALWLDAEWDPDDEPAQPGRIELQWGTFDDCAGYAGSNQKAELDSHHRYDNASTGNNNIYLYQMLPTCPNQPYVLSYAWKPRIDQSADMRVWIDENMLCEHYGWEDDWLPVTTYFVSGDEFGTHMGFESCACGETLGAFVDAVGVYGPTLDDPECYGEICDQRPDHLYFLYDGDPYGTDHDQNPAEVIISDSLLDPLPNAVMIKAYDWRGKYKNAKKGKKNRTVEPLFERVVYRNGTPGGAPFVVMAGEQKFLPPTMFFEIYDEDGLVLLQTVQFHTSCSQPLNVGDHYGPLVVYGLEVPTP